MILIWVVASFIGSLFHISNAYEAWADRAALRDHLRRITRHDVGELEQVATTNLRSQIASALVQLIFLFVGLLAYFSFGGRYLSYLLVVAQVILAVNAIGERRSRIQMYRRAGLK